MAKALGLPYFPITANLLALGPLGVVTPFPAKFKLRVLDPVHFDVPGRPGPVLEEPDHGGVRAHPRAQLQESVYDMLRDRRSVWFG